MASIQSKTNKDGKKTYYVVVSLRTKHKWLKAGSRKSTQSLKRQVESLAESERLEKLGFSPNDMRIDQFFEKYTSHIKLHISDVSRVRYVGVINTFLTFLNMFHPKVTYLSEIKPQTIESYQEKRLSSLDLKIQADGKKKGVHNVKKLPQPQTVNLEVGIIQGALIWAKDREIIASVPTAKVKSLKSKTTREALILTPTECKQFLKSAKSMAKVDRAYTYYHYAFQFILNTGLRSGELCNLTLEDVNLKTGLIKIQAKAGWTPKSFSRDFYLNDTALGILLKIKCREGYIFRNSEGNQLSKNKLRYALIKVAKNAGLNNFTRVHDLRHTFSSLMQINGVDRTTLGDILGHEDEKTTRIYSHTYKAHLKNSINRLEIK